MAITFVQDVANGGNAASQTTAVITVTVTTTVGNHLVLSVVTSAGDLSSVTDSKGNTWQVDLATGGTHTARVRFASAKITSALVNTDTITITTAVAGRTAGSASEFSGLDATTWFDKSASAEVTAATAGDSGLTATTTLADELLYGATAVVSTVTAFTPEVVSPVWNLLTQGASTVTVRTIIPAYRIISATGTYAFKSTWTTARDAANGIVTYKAAATAVADASYRPVILANKHTGPRGLRYRFRQPYLRAVDSGGPQSLNRTADDTLGFADTTLRQGGFGRTLTDALGFSDAITRLGVFGRTASDAVTLGNTVTRTGGFLRSASDSLSFSDAVSQVKATARTAVDALGFSDAVTRAGGFGRTLADSLSLGNTVSRTAALGRTLADSLNLANTVSRAGGFLRSAADSLSFADAVDAVKSGAGVLFRTATDALNFSDAVTRTGTFGRTIADSMALGNTVSRILASVRSASDSLTIGNVVTRTGVFLRTASDALALADAVSQAGGIVIVSIGGPPPTAIAVKPTPFGKAYTERP